MSAVMRGWTGNNRTEVTIFCLGPGSICPRYANMSQATPIIIPIPHCVPLIFLLYSINRPHLGWLPSNPCFPCATGFVTPMLPLLRNSVAPSAPQIPNVTGQPFIIGSPPAFPAWVSTGTPKPHASPKPHPTSWPPPSLPDPAPVRPKHVCGHLQFPGRISSFPRQPPHPVQVPSGQHHCLARASARP